MPNFSDRVRINDCKIVAKGNAAIMVEHGDWDEAKWIPESQIDDDSELHLAEDVGTEGTLVISGWIASQKGID